MANQYRAGEERKLAPAVGSAARWPFAAYLVPILLVALIARIFRTGTSDLSMDEAVSFFIASKPLIEILRYTMRSVWEHPPGFYFLLHYWIGFVGHDEIAMRLLAALGGVPGVALIAVLARRWFNPRVALLAALLLALQPLSVFFGANVRMYAWLNTIMLLAVYLLDRALTRNRWRDWLLFGCATLAALVIHYLVGIVLVALALFLAISWCWLPASRWRFLIVLVVLLGLPAAWLALVTGPRSSALTVLRVALSQPWTLDRFQSIYLEWPFAGDFGLPISRALWLAALPWAIALGGIMLMVPPRPPWRRPQLQTLLLVLLLVPLALGTLLFVVVASRHHSALLPLFALTSALCVEGLLRYRRVLALTALAAIIALDSFVVSGWILERSWHPFGQPMEYIQARAGSEDGLGFTYFLDWVLESYYNGRHLPVTFITQRDTPMRPDEALAEAQAALQKSPVFWLMVYPSVNEPERIEEAFDRLAYPAEKVWFPSSRGVINYFGPVPMADQLGGFTWQPGIRLLRWQSSSARVPAGDALRFEFTWQRGDAGLPRALLALNLYGPDGQLWATHVGEPCNGRCLTDQWGMSPVADRLAFYVPPDVPPGDYTLRAAWLSPDGAPYLGQAPGDPRPQVDLPLMAVHVDPPVTPDRPSPLLGKPVNATVGPGLALAAAQLGDSTTRPGSTLVLPLQWRVAGPQPPLTLRLHLGRAGEGVDVDRPLGPDWYPSRAWSADRTVRTQTAFTIPGTLAPGVYQASLAVVGADGKERLGRVPLGDLTIQDRSHRFDLPAGADLVDAGWEEGIRLARADAPAQGLPGTTIPVTLTWLAGRPAGNNWKVFVHLTGPAGSTNTLAQHDAYPQGGQAPTSTWQPGEVIVDPHTLELPSTLPPGAYRLQVGLYDEKTGARLPRAGGGDTFVLPTPLLVGP